MSDVGAERRLPITIGLILAIVMTALDMTIVNVSLPHMQAGLSTSPDQVTWTLTSFMVATAVMTPISGWLANRLGVRTMLLLCVACFTLSSVLCGIATSLPEMVLFRVLQGATGAPLSPLAQAVMFNINPPERFGRAMAGFSMATMLSPVFGPILGAYITDQYSWRWCFYINLPIGVLALVLLFIFLPKDTPVRRRFDFLGFSALAISMASLQMMLDRGHSRDWFQSPEICIEAALAAAGLWVFVSQSLTSKAPLFDLALVRDRNFVVAQGIFFGSMMLLFASMTLVPLLMQTVMGYSVLNTGLALLPRGLVLLPMIMLVGRLDSKLDRRLIIAIGFLTLAVAFWRMSHFDLAMGVGMIVSGSMMQSVGQGILTVPITTLAMSTLTPQLRADGAAVSATIRNIGASIGVATFQALTIANTQRMHAALAEHVSVVDPVVRTTLPPGMSPSTTEGAVRLNEEITRQAAMVAYVDNFRLMTWLALLGAAIMLLLWLSPLRAAGARSATPLRAS